ncbi:14277_t:CDS:2, partial [Gigaspora rosea]
SLPVIATPTAKSHFLNADINYKILPSVVPHQPKHQRRNSPQAMATLAVTPVTKSKSCTNGERSPQAMSHQRRNFTTRNDDNDGEKFTTNQRRNPPPTTATSTAKSKSVINDTERLCERQFTTCEGKCPAAETGCIICRLPQSNSDVFVKLQPFPDPIPKANEDHYIPFCEIYGKNTSEKHRPSYFKKEMYLHQLRLMVSAPMAWVSAPGTICSKCAYFGKVYRMQQTTDTLFTIPFKAKGRKFSQKLYRNN